MGDGIDIGRRCGDLDHPAVGRTGAKERKRQIVGAPEATVRTRLFHARRKMREMLEAEQRGEVRR